MEVEEIVACLTEALEQAEIPREQQQQIMACFAFAWGTRVMRDLDNAEFYTIVRDDKALSCDNCGHPRTSHNEAARCGTAECQCGLPPDRAPGRWANVLHLAVKWTDEAACGTSEQPTWLTYNPGNVTCAECLGGTTP